MTNMENYHNIAEQNEQAIINLENCVMELTRKVDDLVNRIGELEYEVRKLKSDELS